MYVLYVYSGELQLSGFLSWPFNESCLGYRVRFFFVYAAAFLWQQLRDTFSAKMLNSLHLIRFTGMSGIHDRQKGMHNDISITIHAFIVCGFHMRIYRKFMDEWLSLMNRVRSSDQPVTGYNNACTLT